MKHRLFGTDGIRARVGTAPLTGPDIAKLGNAIAQWAVNKYHAHPHILIAGDTRASTDWIFSALATGLLLRPITVYNARVLPTPAICTLLQQRNDLHVGIVISASHNPHYDNGIKIIDKTTGKITDADEALVASLFQDQIQHNGSLFGTMQWYASAQQEYIESIMARFGRTLLSEKTVVLDCAHGATSVVAPTIFKRLGAHTITIHNKPNGTNINDQCGALHVSDLQKTVVKHKADIGFAFDGDGDRVIAISKTGTIKNGDDMLALLASHPAYEKESIIVGTVMSNHGLDLFLQAQGKQLIRTSVGDKYVADGLQRHEGLIGGEQSGHIILNDFLPTADGILTALRLFEAISKTGNWNMDTFMQCPQITVNVPVVHKKSLSDPAIATIIARHKTQLTSGRVIVRYSGTEHVLRIMVEDHEQRIAQRVSTSLVNELQKELQAEIL